MKKYLLLLLALFLIVLITYNHETCFAGNDYFTGATCPYCGFRGDSRDNNDEDEGTCPSCKKTFLIEYGRQIFHEQAEEVRKQEARERKQNFIDALQIMDLTRPEID